MLTLAVLALGFVQRWLSGMRRVMYCPGMKGPQ